MDNMDNTEIKTNATTEDFDANTVYSPKEDINLGQWTPWIPIRDPEGLIIFYRTNGKKVQVKTVDEDGKKRERAESSCNTDDEFNLEFGIALAIGRVCIKEGERLRDEGNRIIAESQKAIEAMLSTTKKPKV